MQRFSKILFIDDPASRASTALKRAIRLARSNGAELTLATVQDELPRSFSKLKKTLYQIQQEQLQALTEDLPLEGVKINTLHLIGIPFIEIIKTVVHQGYDLVIKPAEGRGGVSDILFGSTDLHLLRKCPCPVWLIKPSRRKHYAGILAAVEPDPTEAGNAELNSMILGLATSLARQENSELHIMHAWSMPYESMLRSGRGYLPKSQVDQMMRDTRKTHKDWLEKLLGQHDLHDLNARIHLMKGNPAVLIPNLVKNKRVELVVMGTVARTGIPGFFIGNTAEKTLAAVDCSVLAIKPSTFSTPIKT